jgi:hypothetical protein
MESARVLVAMSPDGYSVLREALAGCAVDFAATFEAGEAALRGGEYAYVLVGYFFAESRMFEFAQIARRFQPAARVVCIKGTGHPLENRKAGNVNTALGAIGCDELVELAGGEIPEPLRRILGGEAGRVARIP